MLRKRLFFSILTFLISASLHAELPENLEGTWKLDSLGTSELYRNSPNWDAKKEHYLGEIIDYIGRYTFTFTGDKLERHFYREVLTWELNLIEKDSSVFTFNAIKHDGAKQEVQITKMGNELIHIRIGKDDNYRLCAWRKQAPVVKTEPEPPLSLEQLLEKMKEEEERGTKKI